MGKTKRVFLLNITVSFLVLCVIVLPFVGGCLDTAVKEPGGKVYRIDADRCPGHECGKCINHCSVKAISECSLDGKRVVMINLDKCYGCGECILYCPIEYDAIEKVVE